MTEITNPFSLLSDTTGRLIDGGFVYIGLPNPDPETNPATVFWDEERTILAEQPLRTIAGYIARDGTPSRAYISGAYSIRVRQANGSVVFTDLNATVSNPGGLVGSLTELKAAPTVDETVIYDGSLWTWTLGDYTGQADDQNVVEADGVAVSVGAWVRQAADSIATKRTDTGAVSLSQADKNATSISLLEFVDRDLHPNIFVRAINNDRASAEALTLAIQKAIDAASAKRRTLTVPAGLYNIAPIETFASEGGPVKRCFAIRSYMDILAEAGASFRIVNGISTGAAPLWMCMFGTNERLTNVSWYGLEMDMNGQNNLISPNRNTNVYSLVNQAMIHVTGTPGGNAAWINGAKVGDCSFVNTPGVSCIVMGQSNVVDSGLGSGWLVNRCTFKNNGLDTIDHSSIYAWADNATTKDCTFENPAQFNGVGGLVAYEIHGAYAVFTNNRIRNYFQGIWLDGNGSRIVYNPIVTNNILEKIGAFGIIMFGQSASASPVLGTLIQGNQIELDDTVLAGIDLKYGIGTFGLFSQKDVRVKDNNVRGVGTETAKAGVLVTAGTIVGQKHDRWQIEDNTYENLVLGTSAVTNGTVGLGKIVIRNNTSNNLTPAGAFAFPQGVSIDSSGALIDDLSIIGNDCSDDRTTPLCAFGVRVKGQVGRYTSFDNTARGMTDDDYRETEFSANSRKGRFVIDFPYDPTPLAAGENTFADINVPNAVMGDITQATMNVSLQGLVMTSWVQSAGVVRVSFQNNTAGSIDVGSGTIFVTLEKMA